MRYVKITAVALALGGLVGLALTSSEAQTKPGAVAQKPAAKAPPKPAPKPPVKPAPPPAKPAPARANPPAADDAAVAAVRKSAEEFAAAYNAGKAQAIAAGFTEDAEFIDEEGRVIEGRDAIERHFVAVFQEMPKAQIRIAVQEARLLAPNIAIEEGQVESRPTPDSAPELSHYVALHVRQGDQWLLARVRDFSADSSTATGHDRLRPLAWLVGDWVDESADAVVSTSCKWADGGNYLLQEFSARFGSRAPLAGSTRIGWDPLAKQIKSWMFDSDGGYSEALWTRAGDEWILKARGVTHDGRPTSATTVIRQIDKSTMTWESRDRVVGTDVEEDIGPITVKHRPPSPGLAK